MNQRQANKEAAGIVGALIDSYFGVGQPHTECANANHPAEDDCKECRRLYRGLRRIELEMQRRSQ